MAVTLFFGIRLPGRPYERIAHKLDEDAYSTYKVDNLKKLLVGGLLSNYSNASGLGKVTLQVIWYDTKNAHYLLVDLLQFNYALQTKKKIIGNVAKMFCLFEQYNNVSTLILFFVIELVYCGSVLEDSVKLSDEDIKSGSTIHVFERNEKQETKPTLLTEESIQDASTAYRSVCFSSPPSYPFPVSLAIY